MKQLSVLILGKPSCGEDFTQWVDSHAHVESVETFEAALEALRSRPFDVVISTAADFIPFHGVHFAGQAAAILDSINRIANATSFNDKKLLDGSLDYTLSGVQASSIANVQVTGARMPEGGTRTVVVEVTQSAQTAQLRYIGDGPVKSRKGNRPPLQARTGPSWPFFPCGYRDAKKAVLPDFFFGILQLYVFGGLPDAS